MARLVRVLVGRGLMDASARAGMVAWLEDEIARLDDVCRVSRARLMRDGGIEAAEPYARRDAARLLRDALLAPPATVAELAAFVARRDKSVC